MTTVILVAAALTLAADVSFNRDIRPILSDRCFACHGPDPGNRKTVVRFDREESVRQQPLASGGLAIVPGKPEQSELYRRLTASGARRMPPAYAGHAKLADRDIELIREWIATGAPYESHWSFVPPSRKTGQTIDSILRNHLSREGLNLAAEAPRATQLRRVTLDLTGLPPSPDEVDAFENDRSPNAYERVVDRLLASPRHAERMAIRWLEAARYSDTNGYQSDGPRDMYRWRDWVIDAYRNNMPFDQFTIEQIAGDLLPGSTRAQKVATGFHRNHRTSAEGGIVEEEFRSEYVSDRAETTATVWLGLTVGCARCHDHKYDPIPQRDYYRLYAFFNNMREKGLVYNFGNEEPMIKAPTPEMESKLAALEALLAARQKAWDGLQQRVKRDFESWMKRAAATAKDWSVTRDLGVDEPQSRHFDGAAQTELETTDPIKSGRFEYLEPFSAAAWINPQVPDGAILSRGEDYLEGTGYYLLLVKGKLRFTVTLRYTDISLRIETEAPVPLNQWQHVAVTYDGKRKASSVHIYFNGREQAKNVLFDELTYPFAGKVPFRIGGGAGFRFQGDIRGVRTFRRALTADEVASLTVDLSIAQLAAKQNRTPAESAKLKLCFLENHAAAEIRAAQQSLAAARAERDKYYDSIPTVMVMVEGPVRQAHILKRGAYDAPGDPVTAGVPAFLPPLPAGANNDRLTLARWLVDRRNPLTARVTVNRFWQMLFGVGLVKTTEDFGSQGEWPRYLDLLDWLAVEFMDSGWNVRHMLKTIVMSDAYRQSSKASQDLLARDPENRLLARGPRVRLSAEMIRDQALAVSGLLAEKIGGPSVKPYQPPRLWQELSGGGGYQQDKGDGLYRRSLYTYWKRTVPPPYMVNFDSPTRETCTVRESRTNTPLQALNLMNDTIFVEASRKLAERMLESSKPIEYGYRAVLGRSPTSKETQILDAALKRFETRYTADQAAARELVSIGDSKSNGDAVRVAPYAALANLILNLDEAVTKP